MEDRKTTGLYPDAETFYTREYAVSAGGTGAPLHSDSFMQQQLELLSGSQASAAPQPQPPRLAPQAFGRPYGSPMPSPMPLGAPHPSMIPRNQQGLHASGGNVAAPPNLYNYKPSGIAPVPPGPNQPTAATAAAQPIQVQQLQQNAPQYSVQVAAALPPKYTPPVSPRMKEKQQQGGGGAMLLLLPEQLEEGGEEESANEEAKESPVDAAFLTPTRDAPVPPVPPRLSQLSQSDGGISNNQTGNNNNNSASPLVFAGASSPAARPGELLIPAPAIAIQLQPQQPPPPVPPRSPNLQKKMQDELAASGGGDLLDFQRSPRNGRRENGGSESASSVLSTLAARDEWEIDTEELVFEKEIASGTFGSVWRGQYQRTPCAIKKLHGTKLTPRQLQEFHSEVSIMKKLRHPNVVLFMGYCSDKKTGEPMYMVFEYLERGSLWGIIHDKRVYITQPMRVKMAQDIARGLYYLHSLKPPVLHRDVKSPNILADGALQLKVADFGLSKTRQFLQETMTSGMGTYQYMAPEVIQGTDYSLKADVFSYGIVLWEMLARLPPYQGVPGMTLAFKVVNEGLRPTIPPHSDASYAQLMQACWATNPDLRPSFGFILDALQTMQMPDKR